MLEDFYDFKSDMLDKPDVIRKQIKELKEHTEKRVTELHKDLLRKVTNLEEELVRSIEVYEYTLLSAYYEGNDRIGLFNFKLIKDILIYLVNGRELRFRHSLFGDAYIQMNPQKNRVLVKSDNPIYKEGEIMNIICYSNGQWYLKEEL